MKHKLLAIFVMPLVLSAAIFAGVKASSAGSSTCGSGVSGSGCGGGGTGTGGGSGCSSSASPPFLSVADRLYGVAGTSPCDVWAVGLQPTSSLIMHWNGSAWSVSYNQPVGYFEAVSATSASDAWAVGGTSWWDPSQTLAEHWNGTSWTQVSTPTPGSSATFSGVVATSAANAWAVGLIGPGPGVRSATMPLIERWDGSTWSVQSFPEPSDGGQFHAVAATSSDDAWAVGWTGETGEGTGQATLIDHWDGSTWTQVPSPDPAGIYNELDGVTAISPDDAWAVGETESSGGTDEPLIMHWDGSTWTVVPAPNPTGDTNLDSVAAASADDVWAAGYSNPTRCGGSGPKCQGVIMHWDGSCWMITPSPNPPSGYLNDYLGVAALSGDDAWAVGTTDYASTLIAHWDGRAWS